MLFRMSAFTIIIKREHNQRGHITDCLDNTDIQDKHEMISKLLRWISEHLYTKTRNLQVQGQDVMRLEDEQPHSTTEIGLRFEF